jgi:hypothetical protein
MQPEPVVAGRMKDGDGAVRFSWSGIPKNGRWWLMSSWKIPSSDIGLVQKKFGLLLQVEEMSAFPRGESVISTWPLRKALNIIGKSPKLVMVSFFSWGPKGDHGVWPN